MPESLVRYRAALIGASGYTGGELVRLLWSHPSIELAALVGHDAEGLKVSEVHPGLASGINTHSRANQVILSYEKDFLRWLDARQDHLWSGRQETWDIFDQIDVFFFALPHGKALKVLPRLIGVLDRRLARDKTPGSLDKKWNGLPLVFDLSGDFRLSDPDDYETYYRENAPPRSVQMRFIYGLPEVYREQLKSAQFFAMPGCFATAINLALAPFAAHGMLQGKWVADCMTGSSGSGTKPSTGTHHPRRDQNIFAYKVFSHQHLPEILQTQKQLFPVSAGEAKEFRLVFQAHSGPFVRGIYATIHGEVLTPLKSGHKDLKELIAEYYKSARLVRLRDAPPELGFVRASPFCDLFVQQSGFDVVVMVALDNLLKGAVSQAVQAMNIRLGFDENLGLQHTSTVI